MPQRGERLPQKEVLWAQSSQQAQQVAVGRWG